MAIKSAFIANIDALLCNAVRGGTFLDHSFIYCVLKQFLRFVVLVHMFLCSSSRLVTGVIAQFSLA